MHLKELENQETGSAAFCSANVGRGSHVIADRLRTKSFESWRRRGEAQTGHEMPAEAQATYSQTKKCRSALFDAALKKRIAPLNYFDQSPANKDKIICKLTGVVLNKKEEAVWKHMMGKKFEAKLAEKEAEKEKARGDVEMTENSEEEQPKKNSSKKEKSLNNGVEKQSAKKAGKIKAGNVETRRNGEEAELGSKSACDVEVENEEEGGSSDSSDFWMPPPGNRWDFDDGTEDRWSRPGDPDGGDQIVETDSDDDVEMAEGEDGLDNSSSDEEVKIRTKRTATPSGKLKNRRKAKRSRKGGEQ
ncbi:hypothetical protein R1flu_027247 [Riccia fluitans]|uniref:Surfeit locus protein 2 n=1 Tax=Riccia fluitans TaxID=41844 RepID=A0ABD1XIA6_9MARC